MVFFRPGDIVKFQPIDRDAYDAAVAAVEAGTFSLRVRPVKFSLDAFLRDPDAYNRSLVEVLHDAHSLIEVVKPGLATSVGHGPAGYYHVGIPPSAARPVRIACGESAGRQPEEAAVLE